MKYTAAYHQEATRGSYFGRTYTVNSQSLIKVINLHVSMNLHHVAWSDGQTLKDNQYNINKGLKQ